MRDLKGLWRFSKRFQMVWCNLCDSCQLYWEASSATRAAHTYDSERFGSVTRTCRHFRGILILR